tara:strand:- start:672 stop:950 length:279 start_codon:yes stop_codon:yes gene_type:complete
MTANTVTVTETTNTVTVNEETNSVTVQQGSTSTVDVITAGPQGASITGPTGPTGATGAGIPTLGDPGNIIIKSSYTNYDIEWASTLDGGTFN